MRSAPSSALLLLALAGCPSGELGPSSTSSSVAASGAGPAAGPSSGAGAGESMPIKSVVVIVKENRTFDHYFTGFPGAETSMTATLSNGETIERPVMPEGRLPCDVGHKHSEALKAYRGGEMSGFDLQGWSCRAQDPLLPFRRYTEETLPNYWAYAKNFVLCDQFFSTLKGPTTPGHLAAVAAQTPFFGNAASSLGCSVDPVPLLKDKSGTDHAYNRETCAVRKNVPACFDIPSIVDELDERKISWMSYGPQTANGVNTPLNFVKKIGGDKQTRDRHFRALSKLLSDLESGEQADVVYAHVYSGLYTGLPGEKNPELTDEENGRYHDNSEHAPADPCWGENYTVMLINAIMKGPRWKETAIVVTYDDYGGFYDHVAPPKEKCEAYTPGFRLPALVISPYAKKGFVLGKDSEGRILEQSSVPRLIGDVFGLPRLHARYEHARDEQAGSLLEAFDFEQPPREPLILETRTCKGP